MDMSGHGPRRQGSRRRVERFVSVSFRSLLRHRGSGVAVATKAFHGLLLNAQHRQGATVATGCKEEFFANT